MAIYKMIVLDGPRKDAEVYQENVGGDITRWFELDGTPINAPVEDWAVAYTCADPTPPVPAWYMEP